MPTVDRPAPRVFGARVWRDLALLAAQGLVAGVAVSVLLGLAVFAVAG